MLLNIFMKRLFSQLWQWALRYKKRLIYWSLALFISQICFFSFWWIGVNNSVYAAEQNTPSQNETFEQKSINWLLDLSFYQRIFYVLLYPILALAWILVDNSFVYAEVFKFDAVLWQLWNIVRNLANYTLWFLFLFKLFSYLLNAKNKRDVKKILTRTLIAWVWIQASWFLFAVLIDISNVMAYGVWWLPIATLWQQTDIGNPYVFKTAIYLDTNSPDAVEFYLSTVWDGNKKYISECKTFTFSYDNASDKVYQELIMAPKMVYYYDGREYKWTENNACHIWDDVYYFKELCVDWKSCSGSWCIRDQETYDHSVFNKIKDLNQLDEGAMKGLIEGGTILEIGDAHSGRTDLKITYASGDHFWLDVDNNRNGEALWLNRLKDVLTWNYVWVFTALYWSLLNAWTDLRISEVSDPWTYTSLLSVVLSLCHTVAVWIPLIAMVIVFVMRIGVIWAAIILSPFIVLLKTFEVEERISKKVDTYKYLTLENLVWIIFSPVIICFAVSISTVLVRIINAVNMQNIMTKKVDVLWWLIQLNIAWLWLNIWRLVCCAIWVAISWFLIWSAVRASELWKSDIVSWQDWKKWLKNLASTALWSMPIVPIPTKNGWIDFVWPSTVFGWNGQDWLFDKISNNFKKKYNDQNNKALEDFFKSGDERAEARKDAPGKQLWAYQRELAGLSMGDNWTTEPILIWENKDYPRSFGDFNADEQKSIIEGVNKMGKEKLSEISEGHEIVLKWGKKYKFVTTRQKADGNGTLSTEDVYQYEEQES